MTAPGIKDTDEKDTEAPAKRAAKSKNGLGLSPVQVIAGGAAAAVASIIGGQLGVAGTVIGAFVISVISGIALPLFRTSLEKSHEQIKRVVPKHNQSTAQTTQTRPAAHATGVVRATSGRVSAISLPANQARSGAEHAPGSSSKGRKAWLAIGATATIFVIGVGMIFGIQAATGVALSHGTKALQSGISQVMTNAKKSNDSPATDPQPSAPAADPSDEPSAPATVPAAVPTAAPAATSGAVPSADPTAPAATDNPSPSDSPTPAAGTPGNQVQPAAEAPVGNTAAK